MGASSSIIQRNKKGGKFGTSARVSAFANKHIDVDYTDPLTVRNKFRQVLPFVELDKQVDRNNHRFNRGKDKKKELKNKLNLKFAEIEVNK
jgi:hypothetical protein